MCIEEISPRGNSLLLLALAGLPAHLEIKAKYFRYLEIKIRLSVSSYSQRRRVLAHRELDLLPDGGGELVPGGDAAYHRPSLLII